MILFWLSVVLMVLGALVMAGGMVGFVGGVLALVRGGKFRSWEMSGLVAGPLLTLAGSELMRAAVVLGSGR